VQSYLTTLNIPFELNPRIVRGLDYYTHTAFEFLNPDLGAQDAVAAGGRYDGLVQQVGGKSIPAVGIAGGMERLLLSLEQSKIDLCAAFQPDAYLVLMGAATQQTGIRLLNELRAAGLSIAYDPEKESFKAQLKAADASQSRYAIIIGENELLSGTAMLKNLQTGEQKACALTELEAKLRILN
jgi:histidyl-tRNA synthetase